MHWHYLYNRFIKSRKNIYKELCFKNNQQDIIMLLSIVIAAYNAANSIENTLHSISQLPKENIEVIVINDGSTDNTESILQTFSANNSNIQCKFV